jgi:hypothetical protein
LRRPSTGAGDGRNASRGESGGDLQQRHRACGLNLAQDRREPLGVRIGHSDDRRLRCGACLIKPRIAEKPRMRIALSALALSAGEHGRSPLRAPEHFGEFRVVHGWLPSSTL